MKMKMDKGFATVLDIKGLKLQEAWFRNEKVFIVTNIKGEQSIISEEFVAEFIEECMMLAKYPMHTRLFDECGESGTHWWVFNEKMNDEEIRTYIDMYWVDSEGTDWTSSYDCTGRYFASKVCIYRRGSRTLVTQSWGYDV